MKTQLKITALLVIAGILHFYGGQRPSNSSSLRTQGLPNVKEGDRPHSKDVNPLQIEPAPETENRGTETADPSPPLPEVAWREVRRCYQETVPAGSVPLTSPQSLTHLVEHTKRITVGNPEDLEGSVPFLHWENFHLTSPDSQEIRIRNLPAEKKIQLFTLDAEGLPILKPLPESWQSLTRESQLQEALKLGKLKLHQQSFSLTRSRVNSKSTLELEWETENQTVTQASIQLGDRHLGCTQHRCQCE